MLRELGYASSSYRRAESLVIQDSDRSAWNLRPSKKSRQGKAYAELEAKLEVEHRLRAEAMRTAWEEAEAQTRIEIEFRIQAERKARVEAEYRFEIERNAREAAERRAERMMGTARRAHPEAIARVQDEMMARVQAEQQAITEKRGAEKGVRNL